MDRKNPPIAQILVEAAPFRYLEVLQNDTKLLGGNNILKVPNDTKGQIGKASQTEKRDFLSTHAGLGGN